MKPRSTRSRRGRIAGALGVELEEVDLSRPLDDAVIAEIPGALLDHQVIFFRDQHLTPEQHLAFGRRFGSLNVHGLVGRMAEYLEIIEVREEADDHGSNFGGAWHSDVTYLEEPALGSILYAREVPDFGGDTLFANMYLAYRGMDPDAVNGVVRKYAGEQILYRGYSAHPMRTPFITTALENGAQPDDVQKSAGHRDPSTTKLYDRCDYNPKAASFFATY